MFSQASLYPRGGGGIHPLGRHPPADPPRQTHPSHTHTHTDRHAGKTPPGQTHPLGRHPPRQTHIPYADTQPPRQTLPPPSFPETTTAADSTHNTGMHSCFNFYLFIRHCKKENMPVYSCYVRCCYCRHIITGWSPKSFFTMRKDMSLSF